MKKYTLEDLLVVRVERGSNQSYYICRHSKVGNDYIEVLSNHKIMVDNILQVEPLSNYFSILASPKIDFTSNIMLDKKEILNKTLEINKYYLKKQEEKKRVRSRNVKIVKND